MIKIILKRGREESLLRFHPWVFSGAIAEIQGNPAEGDLVSVHASDGGILAYGHYQIGSIAVRVLSFDDSALRPDYWETMLSRALQVRVSCGLHKVSRHCEEQSDVAISTNCYRLVHGEGDNLPGLIIDYYDGVCVMQAHSVGMFRAKKQISDALQKVYGPELKAVYDKSSGTAPYKAGLELIDGYLYQRDGFSDDEQTVVENGHKFIVNWTEGQKTGFFLDQRENRALVGSLARGRNVLNLFCYTGGFSIYALANGALHVDSVDSSKKAMMMVDRNVALNGFDESKHTSLCCDAIDYLKNVPEGKYDLMIVDPPAFAKHRGSQVVDKEAFALAVFSAAAQCGRSVRILDRLNQPCDHSVNIYHPEGEYLKGLLLYVE